LLAPQNWIAKSPPVPKTFCELTSALRIAANHCAALRDIDNVQLFSSCEREINSPLTGDRALGRGCVDDIDLLIVLRKRKKTASYCTLVYNDFKGSGEGWREEISGWVVRLCLGLKRGKKTPATSLMKIAG